MNNEYKKMKNALDNPLALHEIDFSKIIDSENKKEALRFIDLAEHQEMSVHICEELLKVVKKDTETFKSLEMFLEQSQTFGEILRASVMCDTAKKVTIN